MKDRLSSRTGFPSVGAVIHYGRNPLQDLGRAWLRRIDGDWLGMQGANRRKRIDSSKLPLGTPG
jgi:hypothetical protein